MDLLGERPPLASLEAMSLISVLAIHFPPLESENQAGPESSSRHLPLPQHGHDLIAIVRI